jgi:hypothetical protein
MEPLFPIASLSELHGRAASKMPLKFGVPLPKGCCFDYRKLALISEAGHEIPACISATSLWPDNSIKWCLVQSEADLAAGETLNLGLTSRLPNRNARTETDLVQDNGKELRVRTQSRMIVIDTRRFRFLDLTDEQLRGEVQLVCNGNDVNATVESYNYRTLLTEHGALSVEVNLFGAFEPGESQRLRFLCTFQISADGQRVEGSLTLHNPAAARHPGGLWDLGDSNSLHFDCLKLGLNWDAASEDMQGQVQLDQDQPPRPFTRSAVVTQLASGGPQWNSPVHANARGEVNLTEPGYIATVDGCEQRGERADPVVQITRSKTVISAQLKEFWERFPSEIAGDQTGIDLGLLPVTGETHELQPGERCTHRFALHFRDNVPTTTADDISAFPEPLLSLNPVHVERCALAECGTIGLTDPRLQTIIEEGLNGEQSFLSKRETIDEYGWRNFGDLWADHETEGYEGERPFVSHYNNQYDPLFGFLKQYLSSGDTRWLSLAQDLARHTVDIDIYHTDEDRPEYNHGLFWHTDHYLQAETSSHRSYSRRQPKDAYEGHARGGGPGGQHCYTTGLLYHYLLTGDQASRESLYALKNWITCVYEGSGTLTDIALAIKNRHRVDLKNHFTGQYPLDRGVANYLHALMDCYALDQSPGTLTRIAGIIRHTIHPADDLDERHLEQVEEHWYYVVLLQALSRFITLKADLGQIDQDFLYARDSLLHYADWMVENEAPYLEKPDILEFPNQTWTAQDLRKVNVLLWAAQWSPGDGIAYIKKAEQLVDYIASNLCNEPSRHYTRILALLMQNASPTRALPGRTLELPAAASYHPPRSVGPLAQFANFARLTFHALSHFRPTREVAAVRRLLPKGDTQVADP